MTARYVVGSFDGVIDPRTVLATDHSDRDRFRRGSVEPIREPDDGAEGLSAAMATLGS